MRTGDRADRWPYGPADKEPGEILGPRFVYAGLWSRLGAMALDLAVASVWAIPFRAMYRTLLPDPFVLGPVRVSGLLVAATFWAYLVVTTATTGGTLGKHALGLRVVSAGPTRPDWPTILFREVVGRVIVAATAGFGYLWAAVDRRKQGWHDRIADTYVLRKVTVMEGDDPWDDHGERPDRRPIG